MEVNEIIKNLRYATKRFPTKTILEARKHQAEITEILLQDLENINKNPDIIFEEDLYVFGLFLLSEFKETRAFPIIISILNKLDEEDLDYMLGDILTEDLESILASTFNGDLQLLYNIIEDDTKNEYLRAAVLCSLAILYNGQAIKKEVFINYLKNLLPKIEDDYSFLINEYVWIISDLKIQELIPEMEKLFKEGKIDNQYITIEEFKESFDRPAFEKYEYITDTVKSMSKWACFNE